MNKNISIVVVILVLAVIAGYLVWIRSRVAPTISPKVEEEVQVTPSPEPTMTASPSATPKTKEATGSMKQKTGTSGGTER